MSGCDGAPAVTKDGENDALYVKASESLRNQPIPQKLMEAMGVLMDEAWKAGVMVDTAGLLPSKDAFRARIADGKVTMTDGPFAEAKEVVGGYAIMDFKTREDAAAWTRKFMEVHIVGWPEWQGECEVRPMYAADQVPGDCN
ncbi:MAG: hypothetical protein J0H94_06380 [Rhizobiales bacterium]|nr:hypothetical protein [Hyphomicrobiales bacterium]